jgi:hypothetical protein
VAISSYDPNSKLYVGERANLSCLLVHCSQDDSRKAPTTFGHKIYTQAQELVKKLRACEPHYVRCIKPNENKYVFASMRSAKCGGAGCAGHERH